MSWTRIVLVVILGVLLVGVIGLGAFQWYKSYPSYYYGRAEAAIEREDYQSAKLHLMRLVVKHPEHAEGHALLSEVILDEARADGRPASYAANLPAVAHLARAVELRPQNEQWRRRLLNAYLQSRQIAKAAEIAEQIYAHDKTDGDAHLALTWRAVNARNSAEAQRLFAQSDNVVSRYVFHEFALKLTYYSQIPGEENAEIYRKTLLEAVNRARRLTEDDLRLLAYRDREMMLRVLMRAQLQLVSARDKTSAALIIVSVCEKLKQAVLLDKQLIAEAVASSRGSLVPDGTAQTSDEELRAARRRLLDRAGDITSDAIASAEQVGDQSPVSVYWNSAVTQFERGNTEEALAVLARGMAVAEEADGDGEAFQLDLHSLAARILISDGRFEEAREHLKHLDGEKRYDAWSHLLRGEMALKDARYEQAVNEFQSAGNDWDFTLQSQGGLARAHLRLKQWEQAIPHMEALLAPDEALSRSDAAWREKYVQVESVHLDLLRARLNIGQWEESQQNLRELRDTQSASEAWKLVIAYLRLNNQQEKAWDYLRQVRKRFPDEIDFVFVEADMLVAEGRSARANFLFQDFVNARPNDPVRKLAMAHWYIRQDMAQSAIPILKELTADRTLTPKIRNSLNIITTQARLKLGEYEVAQAVVDVLISNPDTQPAGYLYDSVIAYIKGDGQLAQKQLSEMQVANARQLGKDRSVVRIQHPNGQDVGAVIQNAYYW